MALARKLTSKIYEITAHSQKVTCLDLGETGRVLVTGGQDRNVNLWAFGNDKCFMSLAGHNGQIDCVKFAYNDDYVFSADENGIIKRWDLNAQPGCTTFYGHMKSVRTLDFHPYGEYVASGSNDTTVRLWDVRKSDACIEKYRGHIANVNSVKFSPDGSWIASAGTEGSVIIWDIRTRKKIIEFQEHASPVTCIKFHPFEFLLAAGRNDGTVDLYDLESQKLISRTDGNSPFNGHTVKSITFSENGECLFVGTAEGISVIGWEPDREFDHIESAWSILGDMKVVNKKLICGSFENQAAVIHAINLDHVIPFFNPSNTPFSYNQSSRKSFTRGNHKLRLPMTKRQQDNNNDSHGGGSSLNSNKEISSPGSLSFEMIDESVEDIQPMTVVPSSASTNGFAFEKYAQKRESYLYSLPTDNFSKLTAFMDGPNSTSENEDLYLDNYANDLDYYPMKSSPGSNNVVEPEREDFPVNNAQMPDYAPKMDIITSTSATSKASSNSKTTTATTNRTTKSHIQRRQSPPNVKPFGQPRKLSNISSISTVDLHNIDDSMSNAPNSFTSMKKHLGTSRNGSPTRNYTAFNNNNKVKRTDVKEVNHARNNRKITVQILTPKPPTRSKTSFDLRSSSASLPIPSHVASNNVHHHHQSSSSMLHPAANSNANNRYSQSYGGHGTSDENAEISMLTAYHERVYHELSNRYATLQLIRNPARSQDMIGALRHVIKMHDNSVLVDLLGAILEKPASWNLDMCLTLLPELYDLLQSDHKFHFSRACDTLRIILSNFLPIIQTNAARWSSGYGGVDITREERQKKCIECAHWLVKIKSIPDNKHMGSNLTQLQNLITDV